MVDFGCTCGQSIHIFPCPLATNNVQIIGTVPPPAPMMGWLCPACGGGVSPFATRCPCKPVPINITFGGLPLDSTPKTDFLYPKTIASVLVNQEQAHLLVCSSN